MDHYREPFKVPTSREPVYRWPNEIPVEGSLAHVAEIAEKYHEWLLSTELPALLFWANPGGLIPEKAAE